MMNLTGAEQTANRADTGRTSGNPEDTAKALNAIGRISHGFSTSMTIIGGPECAWLAAVAYWFFDIIVEMRNVDGKVLHANPSTGTGPKLLVIYAPSQTSGMQILGKSYVVRDIALEVLSRGSLNPSRLTTRVRWDEALEKVFGRTGPRLLSLTQYFGTAISCAARILLGIARNEEDTDLDEDELQN
jgi:hypothetical protein